MLITITSSIYNIIYRNGCMGQHDQRYKYKSPSNNFQSKYNMRQRSISESKMIEESTPIKPKVNSSSNLENRDPSDNRVRPVSSNIALILEKQILRNILVPWNPS